MFDAPRRPLVFPLKNPLAITAETPEGEPACQVPVFPEDSDEKITVLFRLSLNEFVALASAIDVGADIAYGADALKIWWLWSAAYMCASFCEEMVECLNNPESPFPAALAEALASNPLLAQAIADALPNSGGAVPGRSLTPSQAASDILPPEVRDEEGLCVADALWGACLYLVQSGNRAITDFFEVLESASNTLEASAIISQNIPAAGSYAASAAEFADQLLENFQEGYAAAYTEDYENDLACALFCAASLNCELTPDMLNGIMVGRLPDATTFLTFQTVMVYMGTSLPVGVNIADAMFTIYFTALLFGQQFGEVVGFRPLTDLMSLGADQLASDNWELLCDCPDCATLDFTTSEYSGLTDPSFGTWVDGVGFVGECFNSAPYYYNGIQLGVSLSGAADVTDITVTINAPTQGGSPGAQYFLYVDGVGVVDEQDNVNGTITLIYSGSPVDAPVLFIGAYSSRDPGGCIGDPPVITELTYCS